ncbi:MAG: AAA family ATPase, partial [Prochlorotrichaceae cyanobacterium]
MSQAKKTEYDYLYTGDDRYRAPQGGICDPQGREYQPYIPSDSLKKAVNLAIRLQRPLLLEGEPGCGKTRVAGAIAYEFARKHLNTERPSPDNQADWWNFYVWNITSTSRARDGLYAFDAVGRLRDAQLIGSDPQRLKKYLGDTETKALEDRLTDKTQYRKFGALGQALREQTYRPVVLIDEIDKADSDFPNDLLLVLDELRFEIPETGEDPVKPPAHKPIMLITSNREKPLPEPFLRRCLYFYVGLPGAETLQRILEARFGSQKIEDKQSLVTQALTAFAEIRGLLTQQPGSRPPGTSELLEFMTALLQDQRPMEQVLQEVENLGEELPLLGALIKTRADQELYVEA